MDGENDRRGDHSVTDRRDRESAWLECCFVVQRCSMQTQGRRRAGQDRPCSWGSRAVGDWDWAINNGRWGRWGAMGSSAVPRFPLSRFSQMLARGVHGRGRGLNATNTTTDSLSPPPPSWAGYRKMARMARMARLGGYGIRYSTCESPVRQSLKVKELVS